MLSENELFCTEVQSDHRSAIRHLFRREKHPLDLMRFACSIQVRLKIHCPQSLFLDSPMEIPAGE